MRTLGIHRLLLVCSVILPSLSACAQTRPAAPRQIPVIEGVDAQPLLAQVRRLSEAMEFLGTPFPAETRNALQRATDETDDAKAVRMVQQALDPYSLVAVNINPESRVKAASGTAKARLVQNGWRHYLVKVHNEAGSTADLKAVSPNAMAVFESWSLQTPSDQALRPGGFKININDRHQKPKPDQRGRWLDMMMFNRQPLQPTLSGLALEYRIIQLYSRDAGKREAVISFNVGQGTQDLGFRSEVALLFDAAAAHDVKIRVFDEFGKPTTATFVIRDAQGRVYPSQAKRLAPDFGFHPQVYRADGESVKLPAGAYTIQTGRGPEYLVKTSQARITAKTTLEFRLERWIDPSRSGWWSGDHHIHAAGCAHYDNPTEGVHAPDMARHCRGEDLKVGCNLTWGPCFDYQKQFFTGAIDKESKYPYLLRYDVEVSGFGSHQSGHLCLLRLKDQMYPGGDSWKHWPTLGLNTLKWAKAQNAVTGPAHSGWGLQVPGKDLPNYNIPPFDGIGANEYIVDVTHEVPGYDGRLVPAVDFISTVDTPYVWELNIWYHTLNCGFRTRISGETDFPCIYGERVGLGRSYVKLDGALDFDRWCEGIRQGRNYVSDGKSHLLDFKVGGMGVGENGSEVRIPSASTVRVSARVAALLSETVDSALQNRPYEQQPYWHVERARIGTTRQVPVELIVNGKSVATKNIVADGRMNDVAFDLRLDRSAWVAMRILPSSHTNPVFVIVDDRPIRASRKSADWCIKSVEQCWKQKQRTYKPEEQEEARNAYNHALTTYRRILSETEVD